IFIGYAGQFGWNFGLASTWIGLGNAFIGSLLAWVVLGRRTRLLTQKLTSSTMPEFFGKRFDSKPLKILAAAIVFIFLIPYTASLYNGLSRLFTMAFPGISFTVCVVVMALLTGIYVIVGGYMATAVNDFIQGIIMIVGIITVIIAMLNNNGGFSQALDSLANVNDAAVSTQPGVFSSFFGPDPLSLFCVVILTSLGTWGLPQMVQKFYAIKDEKSIGKGTLISTVFAIVVAGGCYFLGGFGRLYADKIDTSTNFFDTIIPTMLQLLNNDFLMGIVIILVLSASMSTLSSLVLTSSSTLTLDLIKGNLMKKMTEKKQLLIMRIFVFVFIAISAGIAIYQTESSNENVKYIAQFMGVSWGALAGAFLAPFIYGLYWKKTTKFACFASMIFGISIMTANMFMRSAFPDFLQSPINCGAFAMLAGLVIVPVVSLVSKRPDKNKVDDMFKCYSENADA
ncbi:MAG: sodium:solute symporter, partial [Clostridia bacterium]